MGSCFSVFSSQSLNSASFQDKTWEIIWPKKEKMKIANNENLRYF
jgi:hypothetical protein